MYYYGFGIPKDYRTAAKWFTRAAKQDHKIAQHFLATLYDRGRGIPKSTDFAIPKASTT